MSKRSLISAIGLLGLVLIAGAVQRVTAEEGPSLPSDHISCYYHWYHCVYANDNYWSECSPTGGEGWTPTSVARVICRKYNEVEN